MPDNKQIDDALQYAHQHSPVNTANLSPAGKKLIDSSSKWTKNQIRRFIVLQPKKRTKTRTSRTTRTTQYRNLTRPSIHFASGHFNQSNSIFGPL